jgi:photosystem II stability/assembly factor-like uncharacterized protein
MHWRNYAWLTAIAILAGISISCWNTLPFPAPEGGEGTILKEGQEEGSSAQKRQAWLERMHQAAPGINWRTIEANNAARLYGYGTAAVRGENESFADGAIIGKWIERGSTNNAGSVVASWYRSETDEVYVVGAGGTLFKSQSDGSNWTVVNQKIHFGGGSLEVIDWQGVKRMLITDRAGRVLYSEDYGISWTPATGLPVQVDGWGGAQDIRVQTSVTGPVLYCLSKPGYWSKVELYRSQNGGQSWTKMTTFSSHEWGHIALRNLQNTRSVYASRKSGTSTEILRIDSITGLPVSVAIINTLEMSEANLCGTTSNNQLRMWIWDKNLAVRRSINGGLNWSTLATLEAEPWGVGLFVSKTNPNLLLMGEVDAFRSLDGGNSWTRINRWWEYYDNVPTKLHADMMYFNEYRTAAGQSRLLISNHGGLYKADMTASQMTNIGLNGLNVAQYYDVATDPLDKRWFYAGTQDQGFQRGQLDPNGELAAPMDQVISGDYGQIVFSENGTRMWTVYPGSDFSYYNDPRNGGPTHWYEVNSEDESVWLPPLMENPVASENAVFVAGGKPGGGTGSYIIKLRKPVSGAIQATTLPFDFKAASGGELTTLRFSKLKPTRWFACTTNGRFYYSENSGLNWTQSQTLPGGQYLYGAAILPSRSNQDVVYYGGSGYSGPAVYKSVDGGKTFTPMVNGLPPTLVIDMAASQDDEFIFAATETGPFMYVKLHDKWYPLAGDAAPVTTWWSVEYLDEDRTARFGTYGRGAWDFRIMALYLDGTTASAVPQVLPAFHLYPNPSQQVAIVESDAAGKVDVFDQQGKRWFSQSLQPGRMQLPVAQWPNGIYTVVVNGRSKKLLVTH